jgi:hypothetical protein
VSITLIATIGGSDSNSYQDADAVQAILDGVPNVSAWTALESNDDARDVLCVFGTTMLEALAYRGQKVTSAQALAWPRFGVVDHDYGDPSDLDEPSSVGGQRVYLASTAIPRRILRGHAMLVLELARASTSDVWGVDATIDVKSKQIDIITTEFFEASKRRTGLRKYPSVWREILPLLRIAQPQTVERA